MYTIIKCLKVINFNELKYNDNENDDDDDYDDGTNIFKTE